MSSRFLGYLEVLGHLQLEIREERVSHAYLIVGPPQVGKMVLALELARAVNCEGSQPPCGECPHCQKVSSGAHPDVQILGLVKDQKGDRLRKEIGIDQVRSLQHDAGLHPYWGKRRVFIIDDSQRMSTEAANCLLKTLEEPPPACIIVLLTTDERALPSTVISRCRRVQLRPLSQSTIESALIERGSGSEEAKLLARLSRGRLGWALSARGDSRIASARASALEGLSEAMSDSLSKRFHLAEEMAGMYYRDRESLEGKLQTWLGWWRDLLLIKGDFAQGITNVDQEEALSSWGGRLSLEDVLIFIKTIVNTLDSLERNVNPRLALDALMIETPGRDMRAQG
ncbi:MAG: DNA polymerase III subunit delta' [Dehalococcoidia bacterium]|nr:DNA polymerase III subunit delta' [Dehalococcoidia bacterium]